MNAAVANRGAIVRSDEAWGVYWPAPDGTPYLIPVCQADDIRHRSDVTYDEPLLPSRGRLKAGNPRAFTGAVMPIAYVSPATLAAIDAAMAREVRASQFEQRHTPDKHTERCVKL